MKEMTLKEIQEVSLQIMKHIHEFCVKNEIQYSLAYGTLLGAVRHKGFIPWDDDIDIVMPRNDYDRFISLYKDSDKYKLFCPERVNNYTVYARVCEMKETYVRTWAPMAQEDFGVWVDIFPLDYIDDDKLMKQQKNKSLIRLNHQMLRRRTTLASLSYFGKSGIIKQLIKKLLFRKNIYKILNNYISLARNHGTPDSKNVGVLLVSIWRSGDKPFFPKNILDETIEVPFEETSFLIMKNYDLYLKTVFGDYMKLPPEDKRIGHRVHKYFWKTN